MTSVANDISDKLPGRIVLTGGTTYYKVPPAAFHPILSASDTQDAIDTAAYCVASNSNRPDDQ